MNDFTKLDDSIVRECFIMSKMPAIGSSTTEVQYVDLKFLEFLEFLCRISLLSYVPDLSQVKRNKQPPKTFHPVDALHDFLLILFDFVKEFLCQLTFDKKESKVKLSKQ